MPGLFTLSCSSQTGLELEVRELQPPPQLGLPGRNIGPVFRSILLFWVLIFLWNEANTGSSSILPTL